MGPKMNAYVEWISGHADRVGVNSLARQLGIDSGTVSRYKQGVAIPEHFREPTLAGILGVKLAELHRIMQEARDERAMARAQRWLRPEEEPERRLAESPRKRPRQGPRPTRGTSAAAPPRPGDEARAVATPKPRPVGVQRLRRPSYRTLALAA